MATLITTIGTGNKNNKTGEWQYQSAIYQYENEQSVKTSYIGKALLDSSLGKKINRVIVFGTSSTGWGNLISGFELENDKEAKEAIELWQELKCTEENARENILIGISSENLKSLESLLNEKLDRKVELHQIPIAINELEIWDFLSKLTEVILNLPPQEEVYIDITHGLRHHQVFLASTLGFINQLATDSQRKMHLLYGAFEQGKNKLTPVLNLDAINSMHQWSKALNAFIGHGDYEILAEKIKRLTQKSAHELSRLVEKLSFEIAGNYVFKRKKGSMGSANETMKSVSTQIARFEAEVTGKNETGETKAALLVFKQLKLWIKPFLKILYPDDLLLALAKDHLKRHRYLLALTSCYEGLRQFQARVSGLIIDGEKTTDDRIKTEFDKKIDMVDKKLRDQLFRFCLNNSPPSLRTLRNQIVHCASDDQNVYIPAQGFKGRVEEAVNNTIDIIEKLKKNGLK